MHARLSVPAWFFRMVHAANGDEMGLINFRPSSDPHIERYAGHIGYSVHEPYRGHRYAARAVRLLLPFARDLHLDALWITCDPENQASRRTMELAGGVFVEIVEMPEDYILYRNDHSRKCRFRFSL